VCACNSCSRTRLAPLKIFFLNCKTLKTCLLWDFGVGGAERLIVDATCHLAAHGHDVHVFTSHHDKNRCFEETVSGKDQNFAYMYYFVNSLVLIY
jgi:hypothetical protein